MHEVHNFYGFHIYVAEKFVLIKHLIS